VSDAAAFAVILSVAVVVAGLYGAARVFIFLFNRPQRTGSMICPHCGTRGEPVTIARGNMAIEIVLWLCFIIPGIIYSLWRLTTKIRACPSCRAEGMVPVTSPRGRELLARYQPELAK
jgi:hypothetical protein